MPAPAPAGSADTELAIGVRVELVIDPAASHPADVGGAVTLRCVPATAGPLTILVESARGDVLVRRLDASGAVLDENDDGGVEWNARLFVDGRAGVPLRLLAAFKEPIRGQLGVEVHPGTLPAPTGAALLAARADFAQARGVDLLEQGDARGALKALLGAGHLAFNSGNLVPARHAFEAARPLADAAADASSQAMVQIFLGTIAGKLGEPAAGLPLLEQGLLTAQDMPPGPLHLLGESMQADCQRQLGRRSEALPSLRRALVLCSRLGDRANEAALTGQLAVLQRELGDHDAARASHESAVTLAESLGRPDVLASALTLYGDFHAARLDLAEAGTLYERALAVSPTPLQTARTTGQLANVLRQRGDLAGALASYHDVLGIARDLGDSHLEAIALASEGTALEALGDVTAARDRFRQALDLFGEQSDQASATATLIQLASVLQELGDAAGIEAAAGTLAATMAGGPAPDVEADALWGLQRIHEASGDLLQAVSDCERRLQLARDGHDEAAELSALVDLGDLALKRRDSAAARASAQAALELSRRTGAPDMSALATLAEADLVLGDVDGAEAALAEASGTVDRLGARALSVEQESGARSREPISVWSNLAQDVIAARLAAQPGAAERDALVERGFVDAGRWKGRGLLLGIAEHRAGARSAEALSLRAEHEHVLADHDAQMQRVAQAVRDAAPASELSALREAAQALLGRADALAARLRTAAPADAALDVPAGAGSREAREALLAGGATLIEFAEGQHRLCAYVVDGAGLRRHDLGERTDVDRRIGAYLGGLSDPGHLASPAEIATEGQALFATLLAPLLPPGLPADATLILVPTPSLAGLPFEALVVEAPPAPARCADITFVLDRFTVVYGPATPVLELLARQGPRAEAGRVLVLADPVYPSESGSGEAVPRASSLAGLSRLPGTRDEALHLARLLLDTADSAPAAPRADAAPAASRAAGSRLSDLERVRSGSLDAPRLRLHLGADASPDAFAGDLRPWAVIHCAAHGFIDPADPRRSGLALSPGRYGEAFLSVADVLALDLDTDLVVLSACETGRGQVRRGEGVQSVARAFLHAGARSVVASLWQVDDHETEETMQAFYRGYLQEGRPAAAALREARLAVRRAPGGEGAFRVTGRGGLLPGTSRAQADSPARELAGHPYFWAPFVFVGLPR